MYCSNRMLQISETIWSLRPCPISWLSKTRTMHALLYTVYSFKSKYTNSHWLRKICTVNILFLGFVKVFQTIHNLLNISNSWLNYAHEILEKLSLKLWIYCNNFPYQIKQFLLFFGNFNPFWTICLKKDFMNMSLLLISTDDWLFKLKGNNL